MRARRALLVCGIALFSACEAAPGDAASDAGEPACPGCTIELAQVALLGDPSDPSSVNPGAGSCTVARLSTGEYLMSAPVGGGQIFVYGPQGGPVVRTIGSPGQGPQELGATLRMWVGPGDTIHVYDVRNGRFSVRLPDGSQVRSFVYPDLVQGFAVLADGSLVLNHRPLLGQSIDPALFYVVDERGGELGRIAATRSPASTTPYPPELLDIESWLLFPRPGGGFWTASPWRHEFQRWDGPDAPGPVLVRSPEWFRPDEWADHIDVMLQPRAPVAGFSAIRHLWDEDDGRLWIHSVVPDPAWSAEQNLRLGSLEWRRGTYDTVVELVDAESGRAIARHRIDEMLSPLCGSHLLFEVIETETGDTRVRVLEPRLVEG